MTLNSERVKMDQNFHLIFHVGAGKTGTSAIQRSLAEAKQELLTKNWDYWGLLLDKAPLILFPWQKVSAAKDFIALGDKTAEQVEQVLWGSIQESIANNVHTAIWSNEFFFGRHEGVVAALHYLEEKGVKVSIVAYVRNHLSWAKSAYIQWGIKHKTYPGRILGFSEYFEKRPVGFYGSLKIWKNEFPKNFVLRNFDFAGDAVEDFCAAINLPVSLKSIRVNESPTMEELVLRALYNNDAKGEVLPVEFERLLLPKSSSPEEPLKWLQNLLPNDHSLSAIDAATVEDRRLVNQLLEECEQPILQTDQRALKEIALDKDRLIFILAKMLISQNVRVNKLQKEIKKIYAHLGLD